MLLVFFFPHPDHRGRFSGGDDSGGGEGRILSVLNTGSEVPSYVRITRWEFGRRSSYGYMHQKQASRGESEDQSGCCSAGGK